MNKVLNNITVLGAGAYGTALAQVWGSAGRNVTLYARRRALAEEINAQHTNAEYLPNITLHQNIQATDHLKSALATADIAVLAVPAQHLRAILEQARPLLPGNAPLVNVAKGLEQTTGKCLSDIAAALAPSHPYCVLSGPSFASEVAHGMPTALTFATATPHDMAHIWAETLKGAALRPYLSDDPVGAEIGGALKNVIAIACGIVEGKKLGQNARIAVLTRGMAEIKRFGIAHGARPDTFLGLSCLGDLTLTCTSLSSRNYALGVALGQGHTLSDIEAQKKTTREGVATAQAISEYAKKNAVDMPICSAVNYILHGGGQIDEVIAGLLARDLKQETL